MAKTLRTAQDFRDEARSLHLSAQADPDEDRSEGYLRAASRAARVANLMDRGFTRDEATARVMARVDMDRVTEALRGRISVDDLNVAETARYNALAAEVRRENALEARYS